RFTRFKFFTVFRSLDCGLNLNPLCIKALLKTLTHVVNALVELLTNIVNEPTCVGSTLSKRFSKRVYVSRLTLVSVNHAERLASIPGLRRYNVQTSVKVIQDLSPCPFAKLGMDLLNNSKRLQEIIFRENLVNASLRNVRSLTRNT